VDTEPQLVGELKGISAGFREFFARRGMHRSGRQSVAVAEAEQCTGEQPS
jgi:hypothetical protein